MIKFGLTRSFSWVALLSLGPAICGAQPSTTRSSARLSAWRSELHSEFQFSPTGNTSGAYPSFAAKVTYPSLFTKPADDPNVVKLPPYVVRSDAMRLRELAGVIQAEEARSPSPLQPVMHMLGMGPHMKTFDAGKIVAGYYSVLHVPVLFFMRW